MGKKRILEITIEGFLLLFCSGIVFGWSITFFIFGKYIEAAITSLATLVFINMIKIESKD